MPVKERKRPKQSSLERVPKKELAKILKRDEKELAILYEISRSLTSAVDLQKILDIVTEKVSEAMKADICTLRLLERRDKLVFSSAYGLDPNYMDLKKAIGINENYAIAKVVKQNAPVMINDLRKDKKHKYHAYVLHKKLKSFISVPLMEKDKVVGTLSIYSKKSNFYKASDKRILSLFASQASLAIENAKLFDRTRSNYINTMRFFASIIDAKDSYTADHSNRVMKHVVRIANKLGLSVRQKEILQYASLLHDIGKITIDPTILSKPGPLTEEEWKQVVKHPVVGSKIIRKIGFLDDLIPVVLYHHERYGGGGYPDGSMKNGQIPLESRILAIADAYEAMTSDRPYRKALTKEQAIQELKRNSGTQFDPQIAKIFLEVLKESI